MSAKLIEAFVCLGGLLYVTLLGEARVGSVGATRWQRWFYDTSRLPRMEMWPIVPMFSLVGVFVLGLRWPWCAVLVAPIVALTRLYARGHESPMARTKRGDWPPQ